MPFDAIVVGAGPAGGTAAYHLAKRGHKILLLEKQALPRYKPCGGGVSPEVQNWFDFDLRPAVSARVNKIICTLNLGDQVEIDLGRDELWMVRREEFDFLLAKKAEAAGATVMDQAAVTAVTRAENAWRVTVGQETFESPLIIAADGAKGPLAKLLGFPERKRFIAGAVEAELPSDGKPDDTLYMEFGLIKNGYLWNFPKSDGHSIGGGAFKSSAKQDVKEITDDYTKSFGLDPLSGHRFGHPILMWNGHQALHIDGAILAGEAACVVDPFTAEGIRPSIQSGLRAADAIDAAIKGDKKALAGYSKRMKEEHGVDMAWAKRLCDLFYTLAPMSYHLVIQRPALQQMLVDVATGKLRYRDIGGRMMKSIMSK